MKREARSGYIRISEERRGFLPRALFGAIKAAVLGRGYGLSLRFVSPPRIAGLNRAYRGKTGPTDILSFPLSGDEGEILICRSAARREAARFGRNYRNFMAFLFIHGCVHLKGLDHGARMERTEARIRERFRV